MSECFPPFTNDGHRYYPRKLLDLVFTGRKRVVASLPLIVYDIYKDAANKHFSPIFAARRGLPLEIVSRRALAAVGSCTYIHSSDCFERINLGDECKRRSLILNFRRVSRQITILHSGEREKHATCFGILPAPKLSFQVPTHGNKM